MYDMWFCAPGRGCGEKKEGVGRGGKVERRRGVQGGKRGCGEGKEDVGREERVRGGSCTINGIIYFVNEIYY